MSQLLLKQVGVVRSPYKTAGEVPGGGAAADIVVDPEFEQELAGVERSSHLLVVGYFHRGRFQVSASRGVTLARAPGGARPSRAR
jgi:tRNA (Thr-GGU) A37 N-methylase